MPPLLGGIVVSIPVLLEVAAVLATFVHPITSFFYAHGDSLTCRLPAPSSCLGILLKKSKKISKFLLSYLETDFFDLIFSYEEDAYGASGKLPTLLVRGG
jgi:hypothetical protein